jgi:hypothetical protein
LDWRTACAKPAALNHYVFSGLETAIYSASVLVQWLALWVEIIRPVVAHPLAAAGFAEPRPDCHPEKV